MSLSRKSEKCNGPVNTIKVMSSRLDMTLIVLNGPLNSNQPINLYYGRRN